MSDWNPALYLRFQEERIRPVRDLLSRLKGIEPHRILDLGCGPGNSTAALVEHFPGAEVLGVDLSPAMLERARQDCPGATFKQCDAGNCAELVALGSFDLVFSNAFLQWIPLLSQPVLLQRYEELVRPGGIMAMQVPQFTRMPASRVFYELAFTPDYVTCFSDPEPGSGLPFEPPTQTLTEMECYDALGWARNISLWTTEYIHVMPDAESIMEMLRSTALRPYTERLPVESRNGFMARALEGLRRAYPPQKDSCVLFPFRRMFFMAYREEQTDGKK